MELADKPAFEDAMKLSLILVAIAAISLVVTQAQALETDKDGCMTLAEFNTRLPAEGQASVVFGEKLKEASVDRPASSFFVIYTALKNGKDGKGYSFIADTPLGVTPKKICKSLEFERARGLEVRDATVPNGIAANSNLAKVINWGIKNKGLSPMFYGESKGAIVVVIGNPDIKGAFNGMALIGNNDPSRSADDLGGMRNLAYSPNYDRSLASIR